MLLLNGMELRAGYTISIESTILRPPRVPRHRFNEWNSSKGHKDPSKDVRAVQDGRHSRVYQEGKYGAWHGQRVGKRMRGKAHVVR